MNFDRPKQLLEELANSKFIAQFDEELFGLIIKDINEQLFPELNKLMKFDFNNHYYASRLFTIKFFLQRYKRALLIYLQERLNRILNAFWEFGGNIPDEYKQNISKIELNYFQDYKQIILDHSKNLATSYGIGELDLTKDIEPPSDIYIQVRVVIDCGEILTSEGETVRLNQDSLHLLKRVDVESLILQGHLEPIII